MFKRRKPLTLWQTSCELFWPSMGWKRAFHYVKHRLIRLSDSTHNIALGLAIGMGVSFTPILGTHFIQAGIIALALRCNVFSAMIGTFVGNPWTFPFFWWGGFSLGAFMFELFGITGAGILPDDLTFPIVWEMIKTEPMTLFLPWMMGGYFLAFATIPFSYPIYFCVVKAAKVARTKAASVRKKNTPE